MFKILILAIFLMGNAFGGFNISNIKLTPTELEIVGDSLEEIKSVAINSNDSSKEFEIETVSPNQVIARPLDNTGMVEWKALNLVITDSDKESTYPITISQKNGLVTFYKLQEKESDFKPVANSQKKVVSEINFLPGENSTGYDYNYSLYANPTGDFAIKGLDKDLFTIDSEGNVEISGTLKIKGKQIGFNIPYLPIKEQTIPSNSANKVVFAGPSKELVESGYTIPMNICPKGQILKSDGINFVCSLEASQEEQLGPVYTNHKSNFGIDQIYRELQINNVIIDAGNNISGVINFTSTGIMDVATGTFHVNSATGQVGIGDTTPSVKLDITGAVDSGIRLKQGAPTTATGSAFRNGLVLENSANNSAVSIGYGLGDLFSFIAYNGTAPKTLFTLDYSGNGVLLGNLKIGAYTLPATDGATGTVLRTNGSGVVTWDPIVAGSVNGPGTTVVGNIATWNNASGTLLADGNKIAANLVTNVGSSTNGFVAAFADNTGKVIQNGTKLEADLVTGPASATASDSLASFSNTTGKVIKDSGILSTNVMTMGSNAVAGASVLASIIGTKSAVESTILIANIPTMIIPTSASNTLIIAEGTTKALKSTPYSVPINICSNGQTWQSNGTNMVCSAGSAGDVVGPATAGINALARFATADGKSIASSTVLLDNAGALTGILSINGKTAVDLVTMPTQASATSQVILSAGAGKALAPADYKFPTSAGALNQVLKMTSATDATWQDAGTGDVKGPATSGSDTVAVFADGTGKLLKSVTLSYLNIVTAPTGDFTGAYKVALTGGAAGKTIVEAPYTFPNAIGTANQILKTNGAGLVTWQDDAAPSTNTVVNLGPSTDNAIPRFVLASGKEIENSVVTIGNLGELAGVLSINGKTALDLVTMPATPTADDRVFLSTNGSKALKTSPYTFPATCGANQILKSDGTGLVIACVPDTSGVTAFNGRTGVVTPTTGDYTAAQVNSTPTVNIAATNVQAALNELDTEKLALTGGAMTGTLTTPNIVTTGQSAILIGRNGSISSEIRFEEGTGNNYVGFKAATTLAGNAIWILPDVIGVSGTVLSNDGGGVLSWKATSGGDVAGPAASTDNAVARFDATTGKIIQNSVVTISDTGIMSGVSQLVSTGTFTITGDMNVTGNLTAQSYTNTSDRNLKKDIASLTGGGDLIDKLMPVTFRWKKGDDRPVIGLIAQDVEKVLPDAITITKGKDGSIRSYDLGQVLALTIEALKETRAEVKKLEEKIKKLEQKNRKKGE